MTMRKMAALPAGLLLMAMFANAATKSAMRIKVLDSETRSVSLGTNGVPNDCDQITFDAYCRSTGTPQLRITLLVQEGDQPPFRVSCSVDTRWSRCVPLPKGETFDAKREKRGLVVYYVDDKGKARSQLYTLVAGNLPAPAVAATQPEPASSRSSATATPAAQTAPPTASAPLVPAQQSNAINIKCNFTSTPPGAEITLDGKYVGSTPSEIAVSTGTHVVEFSLPGFAQWKRDLTVSPGSGVINVVANLQKAP